MNITEYLVAYLREGKSIEIPGIGTLSSKQEEAHFDSASSTFYPSRRVIQYSNTIVGQGGFLNYIADKECIGLSTADRLWHNYVDVLKEKLEKESSHVIPGIGTLSRTAGGYSFQVDETAVEQGGLQMLKPVAHVKQYTSTKDPFAIFETRFDSVPEPQPEPEPVVVPVAEEPKMEEPVAEPEEVPAVEAEEPMIEEPILAPKAEEPAEVPAPELVVEEPKTEETEAEAPAEEPIAETPVAEEPKEEVPAEEEKSTSAPLEVLEVLDNMEPAPVAEEPKKKSRIVWILLLVLLLLLLIGGGLYYYLMIFKPAQEKNAKPVEVENMVSDSEGSEAIDSLLLPDSVTVIADEEESTTDTTPVAEETPAETSATVAEVEIKDNINIFTFNTDGIAFQQDEVEKFAQKAKAKMHAYVAKYLNGKRTPSAIDAMNDSVDAYIDQRLGHLLDGKEYSARNFMNYKDYVRNYCMDDLKELKGTQAQLLVQRELMDSETMDKMFEAVMAAGNFTTEAAPAKKVTMNDMKTPIKAPAANIQTNSKRGFDVIAGFFSNKNNAQVLTANLKRQGCDAYIIQKGEFYYVSMGSAESRTKADALYNHLKEWYDGDMVIKKW